MHTVHSFSTHTSDQEKYVAARCRGRARAGRVKECAWYVMYLQMAKRMTQRLNERVMVPIREGIEWRYNWGEHISYNRNL